MNYRLTPSFVDSPSGDAGEIVNQSTADVDRSAEMSDTVGGTILQETVAAVSGVRTPRILLVLRIRIMQMLFLITFQQ